MLDKKYLNFLAVAEKGSFSAAAKELYMSQPALSKQIAALEEELGVLLLDRSNYRPILTEQGNYLYEKLQHLLEEIEQIKTHFPTQQKNLTIGITGAYENRELMKALNEIKKQDPSLQFTFIKSNFNDSLKNLLENHVDASVGIETTFKNIPDISYRILYDYQLCVICAFDHPLAQYDQVSIHAITDEAFIVLSKNYGKALYEQFMFACKQDKIKPHIKKEVNSFDELIFSVSIGEGIAIVSKNVVRNTEVKVIDLIGSSHTSKYVIAYHENEKDTIHSLIDPITAYFKLYNQKL